MKNMLIVCAICFLSISSWAVDEQACAKGQGVIVKGVNGHTYCRSKIAMNWWSAHAWCHSAQGVSKLINPNEDCDCDGFEGCDTTLSCPNFATADGTVVWTDAVADENYVYCLYPNKGILNRCHKRGVNSGGLLMALCK